MEVVRDVSLTTLVSAESGTWVRKAPVSSITPLLTHFPSSQPLPLFIFLFSANSLASCCWLGNFRLESFEYVQLFAAAAVRDWHAAIPPPPCELLRQIIRERSRCWLKSRTKYWIHSLWWNQLSYRHISCRHREADGTIEGPFQVMLHRLLMC